MNTFFSRWQRKKILFLISLPCTTEFQQHDPLVAQCVSKLQKEGVDVAHNIDANTLSQICKYDVVIVVAHLDEETNELVLANGRLTIQTFVDYLPQEFKGVLDFSSCFAAQWINLIKHKCPECHVQGALMQTVLDYRLTIYPHVIRLYRENKYMSYYDAYKTIQEKTKSFANQITLENIGYTDSALQEINTPGKHLGWPSSLIYAPSKVERETPFIVQLYIKCDKDTERSISIKAKRIDPDSGLIKVQELPIKLKKNDRISVQYAAITTQEGCVAIDEPVQHQTWLGKTISFDFNVTVLKSFTGKSFNGKVLIEVNGELVGKCSFKTEVAEEQYTAPADVSLEPYDSLKEMSRMRDLLKERLEANYTKLEYLLETEQDSKKREMYESALKTCKKCKQLVDDPVRVSGNSKNKTVFVSSTCEKFMRQFRESARTIIENLNLNPNMCSDWPQSGSNPADVCCQQVMFSDIFLCILGGRYGYIEPSLGTSMTQMEFEVAMLTNKRILAFLLTPPNDSDESDEIRAKQIAFRNYLKSSRILRNFENLDEFKEFSLKDLEYCISSKNKLL